jgi:hypothetical protein
MPAACCSTWPTAPRCARRGAHVRQRRGLFGGIRLDGVLIEAMGKRGLEMIVGAKNDPEWGPVVLAGFGGVTAEILQDVRLLTADLTEEAVVAELMKLKSAALLQGYRGSPALDVAALAR